jgi:serine/threonine protein kinase
MIGKTILHYRIIEKLGEGGMGVVYKAEDSKLERIVAIKFLPRHISANSEDRERFNIEAKAAASLNHPNIAHIYAIEESDDEMFIVMEYIDGIELREKIKSGSIATDETLNVAIQIAEGLDVAHNKGIVHRDIKSSNIMITNDGKVKIMDFGLAKIKGGSEVTKIGSTVGTVSYMSPEQAKGEVVDNRGDIWSFGVVLYEMITGELPFKGDYDQSIIYSILNEDSPSVKELRPEVPNLLEQVVQRALQKESDSRFSSIDELLQGLRKCQSPLKESEISTNGLPYVLKLIKKTQVFIPAILIIAILVFFIVRFLNKSSKERWARFTALPDINRFVDEQKYMDAFLLVNQVESIIPDDPILMDLKNKSSASISIHTTPVGADIYFKDYLAIDSEWQYLGKSPIDNIEIPRAYLRWQIVKEGFQMVEGAFPYWSGKLGFTLTEKEKTPNSMVHIPGSTTGLLVR